MRNGNKSNTGRCHKIFNLFPFHPFAGKNQLSLATFNYFHNPGDFNGLFPGFEHRLWKSKKPGKREGKMGKSRREKTAGIENVRWDYYFYF